MEVSVGATKAYDEEVGIVFVTQHFEVRHLNLIDFLLTELCHQVVVLWIRRDSTRLVVLLQTAQDVLETFTTRHCPITYTCLRIAEVRCPRALQFLRNVWGIDSWILSEVRQFEGSRAVSYVGVGHQDDRRHVLQCHLGCCIGCIEAICR